MKATPKQINALGGEKEIELEIPFDLDRIVYPKKRRPQPKPNYSRVQALMLLGMLVLISIAGVII